MRALQIISTVVVALALAASTAPGENEQKAAAAGFSKIELLSTGGFSGRGNGSAMTIEDSGKVVAKHNKTQKDGNLKAEELEKLKKLIAAVKWDRLKAQYNAGMDMFMSNIAVTIDGKEMKSAVSSPRPDNVPKELGALLDYMDALYNSYKP